MSLHGGFSRGGRSAGCETFAIRKYKHASICEDVNETPRTLGSFRASSEHYSGAALEDTVVATEVYYAQALVDPD